MQLIAKNTINLFNLPKFAHSSRHLSQRETNTFHKKTALLRACNSEKNTSHLISSISDNTLSQRILSPSIIQG